MAEKTEAVDHVEETRKLLPSAEEMMGYDLVTCLQVAQGHASLAIAERLSDIAHELEELNVRLTDV